jgi:hypothetical protein
LTRPIKRLDAIGLGQRRSDRGIIERADNPLRSSLTQPIGRPQRVQASVKDKDPILLGQVANCPRYRLWMNAILAPVRIGLFVESALRRERT